MQSLGYSTAVEAHQDIITHPLSTIKTRLQVQAGKLVAFFVPVSSVHIGATIETLAFTVAVLVAVCCQIFSLVVLAFLGD